MFTTVIICMFYLKLGINMPNGFPQYKTEISNYKEANKQNV